MPRLGDFLNYTSNSGPTKFLYFFFSKRTCNGLETFHNYNIKEDIDTEKVVPWPIISLKWERGGATDSIWRNQARLYFWE